MSAEDNHSGRGSKRNRNDFASEGSPDGFPPTSKRRGQISDFENDSAPEWPVQDKNANSRMPSDEDAIDLASDSDDDVAFSDGGNESESSAEEQDEQEGLLLSESDSESAREEIENADISIEPSSSEDESPSRRMSQTSNKSQPQQQHPLFNPNRLTAPNLAIRSRPFNNTHRRVSESQEESDRELSESYNSEVEETNDNDVGMDIPDGPVTQPQMFLPGEDPALAEMMSHWNVKPNEFINKNNNNNSTPNSPSDSSRTLTPPRPVSTYLSDLEFEKFKDNPSRLRELIEARLDEALNMKWKMEKKFLQLTPEEEAASKKNLAASLNVDTDNTVAVIRRLQQELLRLKTDAVEKNHLNQTLQWQNQTLETEVAKLCSEVDRLQTSKGDWESDLAESRKSLERESQELRTENKQLRLKCMDMEAELSNAKTSLEEIQREHEVNRSNWEKKEIELVQRCRIIRDELNMTTEKYSHLSSAFELLQNNWKGAEQVLQRQDIVIKETEKFKLATDQELNSKTELISELEDKLDAKDRENRLLKAKLIDLDATGTAAVIETSLLSSARPKRTRASMSASLSEMTAAPRLLSASPSIYAESEEMLQGGSDSALGRRLIEIQEECAELRKEVLQKTMEIERLQRRVDMTTDQSVVEDMRRMDFELDQLRTGRISLENELKICKTKESELTIQLQNLDADNARLAVEKNRCSRYVEKLEKQLARFLAKQHVSDKENEGADTAGSTRLHFGNIASGVSANSRLRRLALRPEDDMIGDSEDRTPRGIKVVGSSELEGQTATGFVSSKNYEWRDVLDLIQQNRELQELVSDLETKGTKMRNEMESLFEQKVEELELSMNKLAEQNAEVVSAWMKRCDEKNSICQEYLTQISALQKETERLHNLNLEQKLEFTSMDQQKELFEMKLQAAAEQMDKALKETEILRAELFELRVKINSVDAEKRFISSQFDRETMKAKDLKRNVESLHSKISRLEAEALNLEGEKSLLCKNLEQESIHGRMIRRDLTHAESAIQKLNDEIRMTKSELETTVKSHQQTKLFFESQTLRLESKISQLQESVSKKTSSTDSEGPVEEPKLNVNMSSDLVEEFRSLLKTKEASISDLHLLVKDLEVAKEKAVFVVEEKESAYQTMRMQYHSMYEELMQLRKQQREATGEPVSEDLSTVSNRLVESQIQGDRMEYAKKVQEVKIAQAALKDSQKTAETLQQTLDEMSTRISNVLHPQIQELRSEVDNMSNQLKTKDVLIESIKNSIEYKENRINELTETITSMSEREKEMIINIEKSTAENVGLRDALSAAEDENRESLIQRDSAEETMRQTVKAHSADLHRMDSLKCQIKDLEKEKDNLFKELERSDAEKQIELNELRVYLEDERRSVERKNRELESLHKDMEIMNNKFHMSFLPNIVDSETPTHVVSSTSEQAVSVTGVRSSLNEHVQVLQVRCDELLKQRQNLTSEIESLTIQMKQLSTHERVVAAENLRLQTQLDSERQCLSDLQRKWTAHTSTFRPDLYTDHETLKREMEQLTEAMRQKDAEISQLHAKEADHIQRYAPLKEFENLKEVNKLLTAEQIQLKKRVEHWEQNYRKLVGTTIEEPEELKELKDKFEKLTKDYQAEQAKSVRIHTQFTEILKKKNGEVAFSENKWKTLSIEVERLRKVAAGTIVPDNLINQIRSLMKLTLSQELLLRSIFEKDKSKSAGLTTSPAPVLETEPPAVQIHQTSETAPVVISQIDKQESPAASLITPGQGISLEGISMATDQPQAQPSGSQPGPTAQEQSPNLAGAGLAVVVSQPIVAEVDPSIQIEEGSISEDSPDVSAQLEIGQIQEIPITDTKVESGAESRLGEWETREDPTIRSLPGNSDPDPNTTN